MLLDFLIWNLMGIFDIYFQICHPCCICGSMVTIVLNMLDYNNSSNNVVFEVALVSTISQFRINICPSLPINNKYWKIYIKRTYVCHMWAKHCLINSNQCPVNQCCQPTQKIIIIFFWQIF